MMAIPIKCHKVPGEIWNSLSVNSAYLTNTSAQKYIDLHIYTDIDLKSTLSVRIEYEVQYAH